MTEPQLKAPNWLEPRRAATGIRQLMMYQCALTEGYLHWSMAQTALALTATSPVEYLSQQAKLGATLRKQWTDRLGAWVSPAVEPEIAVLATAAAVPAPIAATFAIESTPAAPPVLPESSALSPGLAAVLPKLRKANTKSKTAVLPEPLKPPPANGSLRPLSAPQTLSASRTAPGNGAGAARSASLAAQESLRQKMQRARKSSQKSSGKRVSD